MKKIILFAFIALHLTASAQLTLLHTFSDLVAWDNNSNVYFTETPSNNINTIFFYNWDFSLYKQVNIAAPSGYSVQRIYMLGKRFVNNDDKIEFFVYFSQTTTDTIQNNNYCLQLLNEDGTLIQDFGYAGTWFVSYDNIHSHNNETRIHITKYVYNSLYTFNYNILVYRLNGPGQASIPSVERDNSFLGNAYPNPSNRTITIPYSLTSSKSSVIHIYGTNGTLIKTIPVGPHFNEVLVDVSAFPVGVYVYECEGKTNKFVVN